MVGYLLLFRQRWALWISSSTRSLQFIPWPRWLLYWSWTASWLPWVCLTSLWSCLFFLWFWVSLDSHNKFRIQEREWKSLDIAKRIVKLFYHSPKEKAQRKLPTKGHSFCKLFHYLSYIHVLSEENYFYRKLKIIHFSAPNISRRMPFWYVSAFYL